MKAVIFDMDGTLLDSMNEWNGLAHNHLRSIGVVPPQDLSEIMKDMSIQESVKYFMDTFGLWETPDELLAQWRLEIDKIYGEGVCLKPFAHEYLMKLKSEGVPFCIATATPKHYGIKALSSLGLIDLFEFVMCEDDVGKDKRCPDIYLEAARRLGYEPKDIVVFEDALYAALTAKEAGFRLCGVYDEAFEKDRDELKKISDKYIKSYEELL